MSTNAHNIKRCKNEKGISLIEVMVSIFVLLIAVVSMMNTFVFLINKKTAIRNEQQRTEEFSLTMNLMSKKIRTSTYKPAGCGTVALQYVKKCTVQVNTGASMIDVTYEFNTNGTLTEKIGTGAPTVLASNVTGGFLVRNLAGGGVLESKNKAIVMHMMEIGNTKTSIETAVAIRNYD